jgi:hypothetical protein
MNRYLPLRLLFFYLVILSSFHFSFCTAPAPDDVENMLRRALGKRIELVLIECEIKPHSTFVIKKIEDGFCLFASEDSTRNKPVLQSITLPIERILTVREIFKDTFKLTAL